MALVKVGIIALRSPDGDFLPATPIYKDLPVNERGRTAQEEKATEEISRLLAERFKEYIDGCRKEERRQNVGKDTP
ncbi:Uncharacterised protein [uncultured Flavonifractor sp.]|nr:Uncharacterised protein [uncultured Flavonifractor sp.]